LPFSKVSIKCVKLYEKDGPLEQELVHQFTMNPGMLARHPILELDKLDIFHCPAAARGRIWDRCTYAHIWNISASYQAINAAHDTEESSNEGSKWQRVSQASTYTEKSRPAFHSRYSSYVCLVSYQANSFHSLELYQ